MTSGVDLFRALSGSKMIDKKRVYTLGEIVREKLIPSVTTIVIASRLVQAGLLKADKVPRGLRGVQYKVKGSAIASYMKHGHGVAQ
jgi:hypothetical protein